jgi:exoribonuclease-2
LLLSVKIGQQLDAIVTGAADKGTCVRPLQPPTEGRLRQATEGL